MQGSGAYAGSVGSIAVCSAFGSATVSVGSAAAMIGNDGRGLALYVVDPSRDLAGAQLPLTACPSTTGTVAITGATFLDEVNASGATFYASRPASAASIHFTAVGAQLQGTFSLTLASGSITGSFTVQ